MPVKSNAIFRIKTANSVFSFITDSMVVIFNGYVNKIRYLISSNMKYSRIISYQQINHSR